MSEEKTKLVDHLKYHIVNSTAQIAGYTPIFAVLEPTVNGMSHDVSINARLLSAGLVYAGLGYAIAKFRDVSRSVFNVTEKSKESLQKIHDSLNLAVFNTVTTPLFYLAAGTSDHEELMKGTGVALAFGLGAGWILGYSMDVFQDLTGMKESPRVPEKIREWNSKKKLGLAALLTAASLIATVGIYEVLPDKCLESKTMQEQGERE